jgi:predicted phosphodiesterase
MKVFILSDIHFPFHDKRAYKKALEAIKREKPTAVVQIGDLLDQYVFSKYSKKSSITPQMDIVKGLEQARQMWKDIKRLVPKAKCYQILGNHDVRLAKRIAEKLPELAEIYDSNAMYTFPGVTTMKSDRDYLVLDKVVYCHGWLSKSEDHARFFNVPTVHGHRHRATIVYATNKLWSMDVGYLADKNAGPLKYTVSKFTHWTLACGVVEDGHPKLLILE